MVHLIARIRLIGSSVAPIFLRPGEEFFLLPFLHHAVILPLIALFLLARHRKRLVPWGEFLWPFLACLSLMALIVPMPAEIPPYVELKTPTGPWFFQGVQLLLRFGPPFWTGVVWPLLPSLLMASLPFVLLALARCARITTAFSWMAHGVLVAVGWWLLPRLGQ